MFPRFTLIGLSIFLLAVTGYVYALTEEELAEANKAFEENDFSNPKLLELMREKFPHIVPAPAKALTEEKVKEAFSDPQVIELVLAASRGDTKKIDALVKAGVDVNTRGENGATPLIWMLPDKNIAGFERLLEHGAAPNLTYDERYSVMWYLAGSDLSEFLELALEYGGDANWLGGNSTIINPAITFGRVENIKILIDAGADVNFQNRVSGGTPLHAAGGTRQYQIAYMLLEAGADPRINDNNGQNGLLGPIEKSGRPGGDDVYAWRQKVIEYLRGIGMEVTPQDP